MSEESLLDGDVNDSSGNVVLPKQNGGKVTSCSSYSIKVCQGPDCTGLGGGIAILEIEELVQEYNYQSRDGDAKICVIAGGCRDFCSVGPNAHILVQQQHEKSRRNKTLLLESFQNVRDPSSCDRVVNYVIAEASSRVPVVDENLNENPSLSSVDHHRSMMTRRAERTRWEALKDVSRTIARSKKAVAAAVGGTSDTGIERKLRIWKETCKDRIDRVAATNHRSEREKRRMERLVKISSDRLDRICLQLDDDVSDSTSYSSSDESTSSSD